MEREEKFNKDDSGQEQTEIQILKQEIQVLKVENETLKAENQELKAGKEAAEKELEKAKNDSIYDDLTGLKSRKFFKGELKNDIAGISSPESEKRKEGFKTLSILYCDIDYFKKINDERGHDAGDEILEKVSRILEENVRDNDMVCRWGGEEIVISLLGADEKEAAEKAEKLRKAVEDRVAEKYGADPKYSGLKVSLSIGVSSFAPSLDFKELVKRADEAMYLAKKEGRNCVRTYSQVLEKEKEKGGVA
jgi:diguanylate cyclase (GGDEF)-like protein